METVTGTATAHMVLERKGMLCSQTNSQSRGKRLSRLPGQGGFALTETLVAMVLIVIAITTLYASAGQAMRLLRTGKENASASQLLQQRIETLRAARTWAAVTTPNGISSLVASPTYSAANFPGASEVVRVESFPTPGTPLVVTRSPAGRITTTGGSLFAQKGVKITVQTQWRSSTNLLRTRQLATVIGKGGLK